MPHPPQTDHRRIHVRIAGRVQGVGFRPFIYRTASELGLAGWVENDHRGVDIEVEGGALDLDAFISKVRHGMPPLATITSLDVEPLPSLGQTGFDIRLSRRNGSAIARITPDASICDDCLRELFDPEDRRYRYPFINCTNCGPRYTIVEGIPYDRALTSMKGFQMCPECSREYHDPNDRRFHAQPDACRVCGPHVELLDAAGSRVPVDDPLQEAAGLLKSGFILAIKGLGGFHLAVNPNDDAAVRRLRLRKGRAEKPFALMAADIESIEHYAVVGAAERSALLHPSSPIVLLTAKDDARIAPSVAPGTDELGFMLAYTPIHHLLMRGHFDALVMTSANLAEEPIAIDNTEATERLGGIVDYFIVHDRPIRQRCDDSVVRVIDGQMTPIRRSRGFVPDPVGIPRAAPRPVLACGGELKNTIAFARDDSVILSQHIGDLDNPSAFAFFEHTIVHLENILEIEPAVVAFDLHPEYLSSKWARRQTGLRQIGVQHHHAHLGAVMAENGVTEPTIGIILDGTGYGTDGSIWGGEVLVGDLGGFDRSGWLKPFRLPGGEAAIRQPWRTAYALIDTVLGKVPDDWADALFRFLPSTERGLLDRVIHRGINAPLTSSCGRLFDGVSAMLGLCREVTYEAQAAIALESVSDPVHRSSYFDGKSRSRNYWSTGELDWTPIVTGILEDLNSGVPKSSIASRFHLSLRDLFSQAALAAREMTGISRVGLSGGVFQNRLLFYALRETLEREGFDVITHRRIPTNDGGLAFGQAAVAAWQTSND